MTTPGDEEVRIVRAASLHNAMTPQVTELHTCYSLIDPQLRPADWNVVDHSQAQIDIPIAKCDGVCLCSALESACRPAGFPSREEKDLPRN